MSGQRIMCRAPSYDHHVSVEQSGESGDEELSMLPRSERGVIELHASLWLHGLLVAEFS
jgi:hypothetical protein